MADDDATTLQEGILYATQPLTARYEASWLAVHANPDGTLQREYARRMALQLELLQGYISGFYQPFPQCPDVYERDVYEDKKYYMEDETI